MKNRNCPNCGAPYELSVNKCPYCGTLYYDLSMIDFDSREPIFLTIKKDGYLITQKVLPQIANLEYTQNKVYACGKGNEKLMSWVTNESIETNINFIAIPDENNHLITMRKDKDND